MYYDECLFCGATLDPGEKCDCTKHLISCGQRQTQENAVEDTAGSIKAQAKSSISETQIIQEASERDV